MRRFLKTFDDWLTRTAAILFLLTIATVIFDVTSPLLEKYIGFGVFAYSLVPIFFISGGLVFFLAIMRSQKDMLPEKRAIHRLKMPFLMISGAFSIILLVIGSYNLMNFTDSVPFCGQLCHQVMYPEYTAHAASPHSEVACADCHIGYGGSYLVRSKVTGLYQVWAVLTNSYPRPIPTPVKNLRPAQDTCEKCHRPQVFSGNIVLEKTSYATDEANTPKTIDLVMRVGTSQFEVAGGIHWHIASTMWYLPVDKDLQDIVWVGVEHPDGTMSQWFSPGEEDQATPEKIAAGKKRVDCIVCHNRPAHDFKSPEELMDTDLSRGLIDAGLPYIKAKGVEALDPENASLEEADKKIDAIGDYYRQYYPQVYSDNLSDINRSLAALKQVAVETTFPEMHINWNTYINNAQHTTSLGCFRCHGKLVSNPGTPQQQTVSKDCQLCHYFGVP